MKHSRVTLMAFAAATALTLSACGGGSGELVEDPGAEDEGGGQVVGTGGGEGGAEDGEYDIALVSKGFQHQFWQAVQTGAEEKAEELGVNVTFDGPASETEIDAQLQMLRSAIERQPDAIGFAALDPEACVPLYEEAEEAGIPIVEFDAGCESEVPVNISKTDSLVAGALAADHMAELIGGEGKVGIVAHSQINSTGVERRDGFVNKMEEDYPDIEVVDIQYGDGDHLKSADIAKTMLAAHSDMAGLYGTNEGSAIGIVNAVNELGLEPGEVTVVGFDSGQAQIDAIKSGVMAGLVTQDPMGIGRSTVESAVAVIEGEEVEEVVDTGSYWVDMSNVDDEDIQAMLYE